MKSKVRIKNENSPNNPKRQPRKSPKRKMTMGAWVIANFLANHGSVLLPGERAEAYEWIADHLEDVQAEQFRHTAQCLIETICANNAADRARKLAADMEARSRIAME